MQVNQGIVQVSTMPRVLLELQYVVEIFVAAAVEARGLRRGIVPVDFAGPV